MLGSIGIILEQRDIDVKTLPRRRSAASTQARTQAPTMAPIQPFKQAFSPTDEAHDDAFGLITGDVHAYDVFGVVACTGNIQTAERRVYNRETGFTMDEIPSASDSEKRALLVSATSSRRAPPVVRRTPSVGSDSKLAGSPDHPLTRVQTAVDSSSVASTAPLRRRASVV